MVTQNEMDISPFKEQQVREIFGEVFRQNTEIQIDEIFRGNINLIFKVKTDNKCYGLRIRLNESVYRYEPNVIKEVFIIQLTHLQDFLNFEKEIEEAFAKILSQKKGTIASSRNKMLPIILYYDWTRTIIPYPYYVYEWSHGTPLWHFKEAKFYFLAGYELSFLHQVRFSSFYKSLLSVGKEAFNWRENYQASLLQELASAHKYIPHLTHLVHQIELNDISEVIPCLLHNDFSGGNILVHDNKIQAVIDWDNTLIESPELDFVKMKYWTTKGKDGVLTQEPTLFKAFLEGYGQEAQKKVTSKVFWLYEILWLLRVYNFEKSKEEKGIPVVPGYPVASIYEQYLGHVISAF